MPELKSNTERALFACSVWLHVGFVGATAAAGGLILLLDGGETWPLALALVVSGGVLAAMGWRRGRTVLERAERASPATAGPVGYSASRPPSRQTRRSSMSVVSPQATRRFDEDRRYSTPE